MVHRDVLGQNLSGCVSARALILVSFVTRTSMNQPPFPLHTHVFAVPTLSAPLRVAFISAQWHADIVGQGRQGFLDELPRLAPVAQRVDLYQVPGAFEMPLLARRLARSGRYDAIVACALVVDGGIYRHEFVAAAVVDGLMRVQLDTDVPVLSVSLTPKDFHEHEDHQQFYQQHFVKKGAEAARCCLQAVAAMRALEAGVPV